MLRDLKESFPDVNFIGIRITDRREFGSFLRMFHATEDEIKKARKNAIILKSRTLVNDSYFAILDSSLAVDDEFRISLQESLTQKGVNVIFGKKSFEK